MRNLVYIIISLLFFTSCKDKPVAKPDRLIDKETMTNILYDISILQASIGFKSNVIIENVEVEKYIYEKYGIDSITLLQNQRFYASDVESFKEIYTNISERIKLEETIADSLSKIEKKQIEQPGLKKQLKPVLE